jgi:hypothetical protein
MPQKQKQLPNDSLHKLVFYIYVYFVSYIFITDISYLHLYL